MNPFKRFEAFEMDVLKEVGNIGAGNAATALSRLLNKPVEMQVPTANIVPFTDIANRVGGEEEVVVAVFLRVEGDSPGNLFFIIRESSAKRLLHHFQYLPIADGQEYSELELSALSEIGNILAGSYLSALADFTKLAMTPTVPSVAVDMAGAILTYGLLQFGHMGDDALLIDTAFVQGHESLAGHFFLIPDPEAFATLFQALGVPYP